MIFKIYTPNNSSKIQILSPKNKNFYLSRNALMDCLQEYNPRGHWEDEESLRIVDHHHLFCDNKLRVSLSHTKDIGAALICHCDEASSVGIDIEFSQRPMKFEAFRFFKNPKDRWNYQAVDQILWAWSLKEAAFKALSPLIKHDEKNPLLLKHIWIHESDFGLYSNEKPLGKLQKKYNPTLSLNIALAFVLKQVRGPF